MTDYQELGDSWINGNCGSVLDCLEAEHPAVAVGVVEYLHSLNRHEDAQTVARRLSERAEEMDRELASEAATDPLSSLYGDDDDEDCAEDWCGECGDTFCEGECMEECDEWCDHCGSEHSPLDPCIDAPDFDEYDEED